MTLAIFDLDNTLIAGDSDHLWGDFLVERDIVDPIHYKAANDQFYRDYQDGRLDILAYLRFSLRILSRHSLEELHGWREDFLNDRIEPLILDKGRALLDEHRQKGHRILIITATNDFVTAPIAERLGVEDLLATRAELKNGQYTGDVDGVPCYREGKVQRLYSWLRESGEKLDGSWFYSDSHNDLPLLEEVEHPVAVDPDQTLDREARERGWSIISLRND